MTNYPPFVDRLTGLDVTPHVTMSRWPEGRPFALFLSHDVDQIHDRELFRVLADVNHIRRVFVKGERGNSRLACQRVARSLFLPKPALRDFETLLALEGRHGFRSTYFLLHDDYWARQGARYSFNCDEIQTITRMIQDAGGEIGVHGGFYRFNNATLYRESIEAVESNFGVRPCGIRNHLLRFSYPETWRAQAEAGFAYDATYGLSGELGPRGGWPFPFQTCDASQGRLLDLYELPLTVMDATLFRHLCLAGDDALETAWKAVQDVVGVGGLVSLLWHNNYFNEPEYWDWQMVYEELLARLVPLKPWCATGAEINAWARARASVRIDDVTIEPEVKRLQIASPLPLHRPMFEIAATQVVVHHPRVRVLAYGGRTSIQFDDWRAGESVILEIAS